MILGAIGLQILFYGVDAECDCAVEGEGREMNYEYWVLNDKRRLLFSVEKAKRLISRNGEK
jgi:hypothetical protein